VAIEVVHQVADEWLAELAEDAADGVVERSMVRVVNRWRAAANSPLAEVTVEAGYSVAGVAARLVERIGSVPRFGGADDDPEGVLAREAEQASSLRLQVAELGLSVRGGRLQTVGR
jgi:hypothetical protein